MKQALQKPLPSQGDMSWHSTRGQPLLKGSLHVSFSFLSLFRSLPPLPFLRALHLPRPARIPHRAEYLLFSSYRPPSRVLGSLQNGRPHRLDSVWAGLKLCWSRGSFAVGGMRGGSGSKLAVMVVVVAREHRASPWHHWWHPVHTLLSFGTTYPAEAQLLCYGGCY